MVEPSRAVAASAAAAFFDGTMTQLPLEISCQAARRELAENCGSLLLDCRELDEYRLVALEGALLVPMSEIASRVDDLLQYRERPIIVYCHHGGRSAQVAMWLRRQGFAHVQSMAGGIDAWAIEIEPGMIRY
jgi:rhodanese-related sulfurtransferase